jgi:hypothetical protein
MPPLLAPVALRRRSSGLAGMPSSSTGASLIAGVAVSMRGVCVDTAGEVLCGKVLLREMGEMGPGLEAVVEGIVGGDMGVGDAMVVAVL